MPRQRRLNGNASGFRVANFADQNNVRIVAQERSQDMCKGQSNFWLHLHLIDAGNFVFYRIFNGKNLAFYCIETCQRRVKPP